MAFVSLRDSGVRKGVGGALNGKDVESRSLAVTKGDERGDR